MGDIVITSIQGPTASVLSMLAKGQQCDMRMIMVGDLKTPRVQWPDGVDFLAIDEQEGLGFSLASLLPKNHYCRKNLGYLYSMARRSPLIFDTDDDNAPLAVWSRRGPRAEAKNCAVRGWVNAYAWFSDEHVWPRGLPLECARQGSPAPALTGSSTVEAPIQQGLADGSPDVDAVWRLLLDREIRFQPGPSVVLPPGTWCPFNSQSTWWTPQAYPLMYLPSFVSFRMTDIWRSFVAQRCLWQMDLGVVFHAAEMYQDRNPHNLLRDFEQEVPGYLGNERIREALEDLELGRGPASAGANLHRCYEELVRVGIVPAKEIPLVEAWLRDLPPDSISAGNSVGVGN